MLEEKENGWITGLSPLAMCLLMGFIVFGFHLFILDLMF
jgi:hypothetical protein